MATTYINTRIKQKYDTLENWEKYNPVLLKGEIAFVIIPGDEIIHMKVGDGTTKFKKLEYSVNQDTIIRDWSNISTSDES